MQRSAEMQSLGPVSDTLANSPDPVSAPGLCWGLGYVRRSSGSPDHPTVLVQATDTAVAGVTQDVGGAAL